MSVASEYTLVSAWRKIILVGAGLSILLGLALLFWPRATVLVLTALVGVWLLVLGATHLGEAAGTRTASRTGRGFYALGGAIYLLAGVVVLANLRGSVRFVAILLGVVWICAGFSEVVSGFTHVGGLWVRAAAILTGLTNIALGIIVLVWPGISLKVLVWIAALWLILLGIVQLYFAYRARQAERELRTRPRSDPPRPDPPRSWRG